MKVLTVLGTRPEIIKLSPLIPLLDKEFEHVLLHTGQHYDFEMDKLFFEELKLKQPKYNLEVGSDLEGKQTVIMTEKIKDILIKENPDLVIVLGDTNSTLAGALAASKLHIKLVHIEAGCRSFNKEMPEERNRIMTDKLSDYLLAPDEVSVKNLFNEGIKGKVNLVGSLVIDACLRNKELAEKSRILERLGIKRDNYILSTIHRAENTSNIDILRNIIEALNKISETMGVVLPLHPRTKKIIDNESVKVSGNIKVIKPLGYLDFLKLMENSKLIMTDSGGIQEEAAAFNIPCLILRNETEWTRLVDIGKNILVGTKKEDIVEKTETLLKNTETLTKMKLIKAELKQGVDKKILNAIKNDT